MNIIETERLILRTWQESDAEAFFRINEDPKVIEFLPGPLTIILESRISNLESGKILEARTGTIGIRMPKNKLALALVKKLGRPITATSANISTAPTAYSIPQINFQYRNEKLKPDLILDSGKLKKVLPSTMVRLTGNKIIIIRRGPISKRQIQNAF